MTAQPRFILPTIPEPLQDSSTLDMRWLSHCQTSSGSV